MTKGFLAAALVVLLAWPSFAIIYVNFGGVPVIVDPVEYRTIAIFGDTQSMLLDGRQNGELSPRFLEFKEQIDWIITNKDAENIDFVLHAGDMTDTGASLSTGILGALNDDVECVGEGTAIDGGANYTDTYTQTDSACLGRSAVETTCEADNPLGCYADAGNYCLGCIRVKYSDDELDLFEAQWDRLEAAEIPGFLTAGNHDPKARGALDPHAQPLGWNDRWGVDHWTDLAITSQTWDRSFAYVGTRPDDDEGNTHAWVATLNSSPPQSVVIVSLPYQSGSGTSATAITWALDQLDDYPNTPAIVLTHHQGEVASTMLDVSESAAPNIFMSVAGHIGWPAGGNRKAIETNGSEQILEIQTDYTNTNPADPSSAGSAMDDTNGVEQTDYITLVRWYPNTGEIESVDRSEQGQAFINNDVGFGAESRVEKVAFDILPPSSDPFDLLPWESQMVEAFDDSGSPGGRPAWPNPPVGPLTAQGVTTDCGALQGWMAGSANHVQVNSAITGCTVAFSGQDNWLEMNNSGSITALGSTGKHSFSGTRIKITGGAMVDNQADGPAGCTSTLTATDLLVDNVNWTYCGLAGNSSSPVARIAVINSTLTARGQGALLSEDQTAGTLPHSDVIFANNDWEMATASFNDDYGTRLNGTERVLYVNNRMRLSGQNSVLRTTADAAYHLMVDNTFVQNAGAFAWHQIYSDLLTGHPGIITHLYFLDNAYYDEVDTRPSIGRLSWETGGGACNNVYHKNNNFFQNGSLPSWGGGGGIRNDCDVLTTEVSGNSITPYTSTPTATALGVGADH